LSKGFIPNHVLTSPVRNTIDSGLIKIEMFTY